MSGFALQVSEILLKKINRKIIVMTDSLGRIFCSLLKSCTNGVEYLLESFRNHITEFTVGEPLAAGNYQRMRSRGQSKGNPGNLADASRIFKRLSYPCRGEIGHYAGTDVHRRALDTYP